MTTLEEGTTSLYFRDFARFLTHPVFSLHRKWKAAARAARLYRLVPRVLVLSEHQQQSHGQQPHVCQGADTLLVVRGLGAAAPGSKGLRKVLGAFCQPLPPHQTQRRLAEPPAILPGA